MTIVANSYRIIGHPICLPSPQYPRNEFLFNFCLVLDSTTEFSPHLTVTLKLATLLRTLEEQSHFLSRDSSSPNTGKIYALCEILLEDLNNYCESMIPIDDANTLNIKLFPTYPAPPPLLPHHVPLSTVLLKKLVDQNWDLTMLLILPYINGINSVFQIALAADADYRLVRKAIRHLLYYNCVFLLDIFSFSAIYAPTAELASFVESTELQDECARYVTIPYSDETGVVLGDDDSPFISGTKLVELYCSLKQGQSLRHFAIHYATKLERIDFRRLITFGVIKGFLYRVHKYAIAPAAVEKSVHWSGKKNAVKYVLSGGVGGGGGGGGGEDGGGGRSMGKEDKSASKTWQLEDGGGENTDKADAASMEGFADKKAGLIKYLDGTHCFDEICTELMISERELMVRLKEWGDIQIIHR